MRKDRQTENQMPISNLAKAGATKKTILQPLIKTLIQAAKTWEQRVSFR